VVAQAVRRRRRSNRPARVRRRGPRGAGVRILRFRSRRPGRHAAASHDPGDVARGRHLRRGASVETLLRPHYLAPLHRTADSVAQSARGRDWILENRLVDSVGRQIPTAREDLAIVHAQRARVDPQDYLLSLGWRRAIIFQPNDRFWTFQAIETGVFVLLGALAVMATVALVRRTSA